MAAYSQRTAVIFSVLSLLSRYTLRFVVAAQQRSLNVYGDALAPFPQLLALPLKQRNE